MLFPPFSDLLASSISDIELLKLRAVSKLYAEFINMFIWESVSRHLHLRRLKTPFLRHKDYPLFKVQLEFTFQFDYSSKKLKKDRNDFHDLILCFVPNHEGLASFYAFANILVSDSNVLNEAISNVDFWGLQGKKYIVHDLETLHFRRSGVTISSHSIY